MSHTLMPWRGSHLLEDARKEVDDVFRRVFGSMAETAGSEGLGPASWSPRVDMSETDTALVVKADVPGVDPKDVDISIRDGTLMIKGEKKEEREQKKRNFHRMERFVGHFFRAIPLPTGVDEDNISATSGNGVVTITIPKKAGSLPKKIAVRAETLG